MPGRSNLGKRSLFPLTVSEVTCHRRHGGRSSCVHSSAGSSGWQFVFVRCLQKSRDCIRKRCKQWASWVNTEAVSARNFVHHCFRPGSVGSGWCQRRGMSTGLAILGIWGKLRRQWLKVITGQRCKNKVSWGNAWPSLVSSNLVISTSHCKKVDS